MSAAFIGIQPAVPYAKTWTLKFLDAASVFDKLLKNIPLLSHVDVCFRGMYDVLVRDGKIQKEIVTNCSTAALPRFVVNNLHKLF